MSTPMLDTLRAQSNAHERYQARAAELRAQIVHGPLYDLDAQAEEMTRTAALDALNAEIFADPVELDASGWPVMEWSGRDRPR